MPILEISVVPVGTNDPSFSSYVSESCKVLKDKGIEFQVTATGTVIEGDMQQLMQIAGEMHAIPFKTGAKRVITNITIDERHDKSDDMNKMVDEVVDNLQ